MPLRFRGRPANRDVQDVESLTVTVEGYVNIPGAVVFVCDVGSRVFRVVRPPVG